MLANPQSQTDYSSLDAITRMIRGHYPTAVLGFRLSSILKQAITSPPPFFQYINLAEYAAAAAECLSEETRNMIYEKSIYMKTRSFDPADAMIKELEKMYLPGNAGKIEAALNKIEATGMKGMEWIDHVCVLPGWLAAYKQKLAALSRDAKTMPEAVMDAEAVRFADQVMRDVQPSSDALDLAPIFWDKSPLKQLFLQFQVPMSVIFQNLADDAPNNFRHGRIREALTTFGIYAMTAAATGLLAEDDDDEKLNPKYRAVDALGGLIESVPVVGGGAAYAVESLLRTGKIKPSYRNMFPIPETLGRTVNAISDAKWGKAMSSAVDMMFYATGLPEGMKREAERALEEGDWTVIFGNR
jgi:hypothetical protein